MKVSFSSKGDFNNADKWLHDVARRSPKKALNAIAVEGERSLARNTPRDTGATAAGWKAKVTSKKGVSEIAWNNVAHPNTRANVAVLIEQGHGTGTGGYVPPRPFIKRSMDRVFDNAGDRLREEMTK
jgi:Bacteriophage HK97-gp10, putative tail-component